MAGTSHMYMVFVSSRVSAVKQPGAKAKPGCDAADVHKEHGYKWFAICALRRFPQINAARANGSCSIPLAALVEARVFREIVPTWTRIHKSYIRPCQQKIWR